MQNFILLHNMDELRSESKVLETMKDEIALFNIYTLFG